MRVDRMYRPPTGLPSLLIWTTGAIGVASLAKGLSQLAFAAAMIWVYVTVAATIAGRLVVLWQILKLTLPLAIPLLLIHGVLNPTFGRTDAWLGVPVRFDGFVFGAIISLRILLLALVAVLWSVADSQRLFWDAIRWRVPLPLITGLALGASTVQAIRRRAVSVLMAQQARGLPVHGNAAQRGRALVAVVIPVVTTTLMESAMRGESLALRGFGSKKLTCPPMQDAARLMILECVVALLAFVLVFAYR